jgi:hypothetical protein
MTDVKQALIKVEPVAGRFIPGIPAVAQEVNQDEADRLVASGAFVKAVDKPTAPAEKQEAKEQ